MKHYNPWLEDFYAVCKKFEEDEARRKAEKKARQEASANLKTSPAKN